MKKCESGFSGNLLCSKTKTECIVRHVALLAHNLQFQIKKTWYHMNIKRLFQGSFQ